MPTVEITLLQTTTTTTTPTLLPPLRAVRTALATHIHPTLSRFYHSLSSPPSQIYLFGTWDSSAQHRAFLADAVLRERILGAQEGVFEVRFSVDVELELGGADVHPSIRAKVGKEGLGLGRVLGVVRTRATEAMNVAGIKEKAIEAAKGKDDVLCLYAKTIGEDRNGVMVFGLDGLAAKEGEDESSAWLKWEERMRETCGEGVDVLVVKDMES